MLTYFPIGYIHYIAFTLYVLMAVYILKNGLTSRINISAAGMIVCFSLWSLGLSIKHNPLTTMQTASIAEHIGALGWVTFPFFTLWFFMEISSKNKFLKKPLVLPLLALPGLFFYIIELFNMLQLSPIYSVYGWYSPWADSNLPLFYQLYYLSYLVIGLILLLKHAYKNKSKKKQALVIFWGTVASISAGTFSEVIAPKLFNFYGVFTEMADLYVIIWASSITYAVTKLSVFKPNPENMAQKIVSEMNESLVILDDSFNITYVNSSASKLLEIPEGSKKTHNFISVFPYIDGGASFFDTFDKTSGSNTVKTFAINSLGKKIPVSVSITLIRKINETLGAVCLIEDKSESILFEEMLRKERDLAKKYIDIAGVMLVALNKKGQITLINKKGCEILGYFDREQLIGKNWFDDFVPPDNAADAKNVFKRLSKNTIIDGYVENYIIRKDGKRRLIKWSNAVMFDDTGMFAGTISSGEDITEEKAYQEEMAKLVTAVEQSPSSVVITDLWGNITYVNPKFCSVTGYTKNEALGNNPRILKSGEMDASNYKILWDTISKGGQWHGEFHNVKKDGTKFWESASISAVKDYKNRIFSYIAIKEDITEKRKQEEILRQSYEKLKELDTLKTNFTSMVSHELRTPLTSIKGFVSFLLGGVGGKLSPKQKDFVLTIKNNSERLLSLINDLLDLSKMESGTFSISKKTTNIIPVIAASISDISSIAEKKSIIIKINSPYTAFDLSIDEYRISQVLINLLNNSIKFSPPGSQIEIELKETLKNKISLPDYEDMTKLTAEKYLLIRIIDHGPGLTKDNARRIFDRFYQVEDINTRKAQGTGLGLSIVENIVQLHDGIVWADSEGPGLGSVFSFILPLR
ncbi:MAG: PAS domain S-box protein [Candidatus Goldbacteria bacterium]|nr:PAS domain S-box protein [Candidatus Goldiibacteriota bacterium]